MFAKSGPARATVEATGAHVCRCVLIEPSGGTLQRFVPALVDVTTEVYF